jgi:hypothetical protein
MYVIFNGPPGSGKDEACQFLMNAYGYKHLRMKDELFVDTAKYFNVDMDWFMSDYDNRTEKETPRKELGGLSKRQALIHVSEVVMKPTHGKDYYGKKTAEKIDMVSSYCFSDGGFIEEILPVINTVGHENICIAQLYRTGCSFSSDSRNYIHGILQEDLGKKEIELQNTKPQIPIRMYRLHNNTSVSDFHQMIRKIIRKEANARSKSANLLGKPLRRSMYH